MGDTTDDVTDLGFDADVVRPWDDREGQRAAFDSGEAADGDCWAPWTDTGGEG